MATAYPAQGSLGWDDDLKAYIDSTVADAAAADAAARIPKALFDAKGDILVASANDTPARLGVGADNRQLFADSSQATGMRWGNEGELPKSRTLASLDLNTVVASGVYFADTTCTNLPVAATAGYLNVYNQTGTPNSIQIFYTIGSDRTFLRRTGNAGTTWSAWSETTTQSLVDAKGDLLVGSADNTLARLAVGTNGASVFADSTQATGLRWGVAGELPAAGQVFSSGDLNTVITPGTYLVNGSAANLPLAASGGYMRVTRTAGSNTILQEYVVTLSTSRRSFHRYSNDGGTTWQPWVELVSASGASTMTGSLVFDRAGNAFLDIRRSGAPADSGRWQVAVQGSDGRMTFDTYNDAATFLKSVLTLRRDGGMTVDGILHFKGTGSPEGVVSAAVGSRYVDTAATNGAVEWVKFSGTGNTGWRVVLGDTGWRKVLSWTAGVQDAANQIGTIDTTQYSLSGTGSCMVRRVDQTVTWVFSTGSGGITKTNSGEHSTGATCPNGFLPSGNAYGGQWWGGVLGQYNRVSDILSVRTSSLLWIRSAAAATLFDEASASYTTVDAWPAALPGVAG